MKRNSNILQIPLSRIFILLLMDVITIMIASFAAIFIRFELRFSMIPEKYMNAYERVLPYTLLITICFFVLWKLYKSVWRYASATELINIAAATTCAAISQVLLCQI